jgi:hypothetical protein
MVPSLPAPFPKLTQTHTHTHTRCRANMATSLHAMRGTSCTARANARPAAPCALRCAAALVVPRRWERPAANTKAVTQPRGSSVLVRSSDTGACACACACARACAATAAGGGRAVAGQQLWCVRCAVGWARNALCGAHCARMHTTLPHARTSRRAHAHTRAPHCAPPPTHKDPHTHRHTPTHPHTHTHTHKVPPTTTSWWGSKARSCRASRCAGSACVHM